MAEQYSQSKAVAAITKAGLKSIFRSPSTVAFSFGFPLIFILVFGFLSNNNKAVVKTAFSVQTDSTTPVYKLIAHNPAIYVVHKDEIEIKEDLSKGRLAAIINITKLENEESRYALSLTSSESVSVQQLKFF